MAPLAETTALYEAISAGDVGPPLADAGRAARREAVVGRYPLDRSRGRGRARCSPRSVPAGSSWWRASRAWARPVSSRRSSRRPGAPGADGALLRPRRRRALRARSSTCSAWRLADPTTRDALAALPRVGRDARRPDWCPSSARPTPRRHPVDGPGAEARFLDGLARAVAAAGARLRACSSSTTCSGPTTPPSRCSPTWCTAAATTGRVWSSPSAAVRSAIPDRSRRALGDRLRDGAGVAIRLGRLVGGRRRRAGGRGGARRRRAAGSPRR